MKMVPGQDTNSEYYPGTSKRVRSFSDPEPEEQEFFGEPIIRILHGQETEFFTSGQLGYALNRKAGTIRLWERQGTIPKPTFTLQKDNRYAKRRLYSRPQVEGLRQIAREEGILSDTARHITKTNFAARAANLFRELKT